MKRDTYPPPFGTPEDFRWSSLADARFYRERKIRLYCCGGCRLLWDHLTDPDVRRAVEVAERIADDRATAGERHTARSVLDRAECWEKLWAPVQWSETSGEYGRAAARYYGTRVAVAALHDPGTYLEPDPEELRSAGRSEHTRLHAALHNLHWAFTPGEEFFCAETHALWLDVFGNFLGTLRPAAEWLTQTVLALAREMYASRDFGAMPILADALQDAGCENADVLDHCRGSLPHVRGCWVVDLILGKE